MELVGPEQRGRQRAALLLLRPQRLQHALQLRPQNRLLCLTGRILPRDLSNTVGWGSEGPTIIAALMRCALVQKLRPQKQLLLRRRLAFQFLGAGMDY